MKKLITLLVLITASMYATAQYDAECELFAQKVTNSLNGVVIHEVQPNEKVKAHAVRISDSYDLNLIVTVINSAINKYSDVKVFKGWHLSDDGYYVIKLEVTEGKGMLIQYNENTNEIYFLWLTEKL